MLRPRRDRLDITGPNANAVDLERPLDHRAVRQDLAVVLHEDVDATQRVLPV